MTLPITVNSRWGRKQVPIELTVTRVTYREVSYIAEWQFLQDFQPVTERKKKTR